MPKKVFNALPKAEGSKDHLNIVEDYNVHYNAECATCPMTKTWYVGKSLSVLEDHYEAHHRDLVENEKLPLLLESYIYFHFVLKGKGSPKSEMWRLKHMKVTSGCKKGHLPKSGVDEEYV
eukprot:12325592-Ditylum_brightwellii.AAC.1